MNTDTFTSMTDTLANRWRHPKNNSITLEQYALFEREWIIYILKDYRYGQAFCEFFEIGNATPLYHFNDDDISKRWIENNYLVK